MGDNCSFPRTFHCQLLDVVLLYDPSTLLGIAALQLMHPAASLLDAEHEQGISADERAAADDLYSSEAYSAGATVQQDVTKRGSALLNDLGALDDRAAAAEISLTKYEPQYEAVAQQWSGTAWSKEMRAATVQVRRACAAELGGSGLAMPNPWAGSGIKTTSKRYLERLL